MLYWSNTETVPLPVQINHPELQHIFQPKTCTPQLSIPVISWGQKGSLRQQETTKHLKELHSPYLALRSGMGSQYTACKTSVSASVWKRPLLSPDLAAPQGDESCLRSSDPFRRQELQFPYLAFHFAVKFQDLL